MKTLYAYCPSCRKQAPVDAFAGLVTYKTHPGPDVIHNCAKSGETCWYIPRDHLAGGAVDRKGDV